jgi:hypothetical protein
MPCLHYAYCTVLRHLFPIYPQLKFADLVLCYLNKMLPYKKCKNIQDQSIRTVSFQTTQRTLKHKKRNSSRHTTEYYSEAAAILIHSIWCGSAPRYRYLYCSLLFLHSPTSFYSPPHHVKVVKFMGSTRYAEWGQFKGISESVGCKLSEGERR